MNRKITGTILLLCFLLLHGEILLADTPEIDVKENTVIALEDNLWIARFHPFSNASGYYALGFYANGSSKNYSLLYIEGKRIVKALPLPIPVDTISSPYLFKGDARVFDLIDERYLYVGVRHLEGNVYLAVIDTHEANKVISSFKIDSSGFSDIFVDNNGKMRIIGTNEKPFVTVIDRDQGVLKLQKKLGGTYPEAASAAALLSGGKMMMASNHVIAGSVKSSVYLLDEYGEVQRETEMDGVVFNILSSSADTALVMRSLDEVGENTEAIVYDPELKEVSKFGLPSLGRLLSPVNQASAVGKSDLMLTEVGSREGNNKFIDVIHMGAGREMKVATLLENTHTDKEAVYDTIISRQGTEIRIGVTVMQEKNNVIERTFTIYKMK